MQTEPLPNGYKCLCKKFNRFTSYVYSNWHDRVVHVCECGRQNVIKQGYVLVYLPREKK